MALTTEDRRYVLETLFCVFFCFCDLYFIWPFSHALAILLIALVISAMLIFECWNVESFITGGLMITIAGIVAIVYPRAETETHGWIVPANDPSPPPVQNCEQFKGPEDSFVYFGSNEGAIKRGAITTIATIANQRTLSFVVTDQGISISGDLYSESGSLAHIDRNEFTINPNTTFRSEHPDRSTFIIRDNAGRENLRIRYLNRHAITFTGILFRPGRAPITVTDSEVTFGRGARLTGGCLGPGKLIDIGTGSAPHQLMLPYILRRTISRLRVRAASPTIRCRRLLS